MNIINAVQNLRAAARRWLPGKGAATRRMGLAAALLAAPLAHAGFTNGDFETGDFSGWTVTNYSNNGIATFPPTQKSHLNLQAPGNTPVNAVVSAPPGTAPAPDAPSGVLSIPFKGSYSARINARGNNYRAAGIYQEATMTLADVDPSDGKIHLRMAVAPVIQDGGHGYSDQAYFYVEVRNKTKNRSLFYTFNFAAQPGIPWQTVGGYQYTGWQAIDVAPGSGLLDVGDVVTVEIIAAGCSAGGHSGEIYVDSIAPFFAGLSIAATGPTSSKPGDNVAYTYNYGNTSGVMVFNGQVVVKAPQSVKTGGAASQPNAADYLDATFVSASGASCVQAPAGTVTCDVGDMVDHASGSFSIVWQVPANSSTSSPTNVLNHGDYAISANGASTVRGPLVQTQLLGSTTTLADLAVTVTDGTTAVAPNGSTTYTVTVTNNGPNDVTNAPLSQTVSNLTVGNWTCTGSAGASCSSGSGTGTVASLTLTIPAGQSITLQVPATAAASGNASTTFTIATPGGITDSNTANNVAGDTDQIGILRDLSVTKSGTGAGTVVTSQRDLVCDTSGTPVCSIKVADGATKYLTATAAPGSIFTGWTSGPCLGSTTNPCAVTNITADTTANAAFALAYIVTPTQSGTGGTFGPATPQQVAGGSSTAFTLTPDSGKYPVIDLPASGTACTGTLSGTSAPYIYTVNPVNADCGFTVKFVNGVKINASVDAAANQGTISPSGDTALMAPGANNTVFTLTPNTGYAPVMSGTCKGVFDGTAIPNTYTVTNTASDCTVITAFTNDPVTVTSSATGGGGSIDTTGTINLPRGGARVYTFTPDAGNYPLVTGNCPGKLVGNTYTVDPVTADCAFSVAFTSQTVALTGTVTGGTGTLAPNGPITVAQGGGQTFTATPGGGYVTVFEDTTTCPGTRSGNVYDVSGAAANCAVNVKFVAAAAAVTVTATVPGGNGTAATPGQNAAGETVLAAGDTRVWTLTPNVPGMVPRVMPGSTCTGTLNASAPFTYTVTNATASCAVAFAFAVPAPAAIPTLSQWGLVALSALLGLFMAGMHRRRMP